MFRNILKYLCSRFYLHLFDPCRKYLQRAYFKSLKASLHMSSLNSCNCKVSDKWPHFLNQTYIIEGEPRNKSKGRTEVLSLDSVVMKEFGTFLAVGTVVDGVWCCWGDAKLRQTNIRRGGVHHQAWDERNILRGLVDLVQSTGLDFVSLALIGSMLTCKVPTIIPFCELDTQDMTYEWYFRKSLVNLTFAFPNGLNTTLSSASPNNFQVGSSCRTIKLAKKVKKASKNNNLYSLLSEHLLS